MSLTLSQIETALGQAVASITEIDRIAWPNRVTDPARPFVMFQHVPGVWDDRTVTGGGFVQASGAIQLTVVTTAGEFSTPANALADAIIAAFPKGRRIAAGDGCVIISQPARPVAATLDGADWRQTVEVTYTTETA